MRTFFFYLLSFSSPGLFPSSMKGKKREKSNFIWNFKTFFCSLFSLSWKKERSRDFFDYTGHLQHDQLISSSDEWSCWWPSESKSLWEAISWQRKRRIRAYFFLIEREQGIDGLVLRPSQRLRPSIAHAQRKRSSESQGDSLKNSWLKIGNLSNFLFY